MLRRKIYNQIEKFYKSNPNKALMITRARQVGKSTIVEEFANKHFKHFIKMDFIKNEEYVTALSGTKSTDVSAAPCLEQYFRIFFPFL